MDVILSRAPAAAGLDRRPVAAQRPQSCVGPDPVSGRSMMPPDGGRADDTPTSPAARIGEVRPYGGCAA
jgi:hypothetical protein